ncbi:MULTISPECIES: serine/threonine protein kinase [Saccharibacillus]|uniref:serine/threonine protein kinase n=1 Tax=Saccharibacillus TaxID=456492 RepID=UPI00123A511E|nr:serine/threonine protein kinase [Saccharibacillus sp. WB 17]MWJ30097.1 serine/threonine protein kinase [Saccharibacillus sp. WB 17]
MNADFRQKELSNWETLLNQLFPSGIPETFEWTNKTKIIEVLNGIGNSEASNHTFFPSGGGLDLSSAKESNEQGCIEVKFDSLSHILKIYSLRFQSFPGSPLEWAHFRIITSSLDASGVYENLSRDSEELTEITPGSYINRSYSEHGEYNGKPLPRTARTVVRVLGGDFVIFSKGSLYNANSSTYDGRHNNLGDQGFTKHLKDVIKHLEEKD